MCKDEVGVPDRKEEIYRILRNQILSISLKPGEMISENALAQDFNISRSVLRDVLSRLNDEGYTVSYPQKGTQVSLIYKSRVTQAVQAYIMLMQPIVEEVCKKGLKIEQKKQLEECLRQQSLLNNKSDGLELLAAERHVYALLSSFIGKNYVWDYFRPIDCDMMRVNYMSYMTFNFQVHASSLTSWEHVVVEARLLTGNILQGDIPAAKLLCASHFNNVLVSMNSLFAVYPEYFGD